MNEAEHGTTFKRPADWPVGPSERAAAAWNDPEARQQRGRRAGQRRRLARDWARIHLRRAAHRTHGTLAIQQAVGPASFLVVSAALGVALTLTTLYAPSYAVTVDGEQVGVVSDREVVDQAIADVEAQGSSLLGYDYQVQGDIGYQFALTLKTDLSSQNQIEDYFYSQLNDVSVTLRKCQVVVDGQTVGVVKDETALRDMLDQLKNQYVNENTTSVEFMQDVSIQYVYAADNVLTTEEMQAALQSNGSGSGTYTVVKGDTFNGIAYANDMSVSDLKALNPSVDINRLMIGDVLNVKAQTPVLSVKTTEHQVYSQDIECPVETREDSSMYKGTSKIVTQGVKGEARIEADVTYVNGQEQQRDILSNVTVREPTTTIKAVGTKEKPKTASTGSFSWPISGRITSYFGGRYIFGRYSYHSGIDISASYGASVRAADGGTVTFAGYKGSYGNLVVITHDNGTQTYYGHNSSLLVSAGQKVSKGQTIARAGSTGRSTGTHCHFEVRVRGSAVNPLNYLR